MQNEALGPPSAPSPGANSAGTRGPRRAVVTGAARGFGEQIVQRLRDDFDEVIALGVQPRPGVIDCDVADADAVRQVAKRVGRVDLLVNNAAVWRFAAFRDVTVADFDVVLAVNVRGPFNCMQASFAICFGAATERSSTSSRSPPSMPIPQSAPTRHRRQRCWR